MLLAMKNARFGQIALLIAGFLAIAGSFGLHPEPGPGLTGPSSSSAPGYVADSSAGKTPHECLACLAHRSISLPRLAAVVLRPASAVRASVSRAPSLIARLDAHPREGRAPPALG